MAKERSPGHKGTMFHKDFYQIQIMKPANPRFEFRAFAKDFGLSEQLIQQKSSDSLIRESNEIYIVSAKTNTHNTKIRYDLLDIKQLLKTEKGLEQWCPVLKASFPLSEEIIVNEIFEAFNTKPQSLNQESYSLNEFLEKVILPHPDLTSVQVRKKRWGYTINNCMCEIANVQIEDKIIKTVAVESTEIDDILKTVKLLQLDQYENLNYLAAIKQVLGIHE